MDQEYKNNEIAVKVQRKPECIVELRLHAAPSLVHASHSKATKTISKEVSLPGFRKGKAPEAMISKKFPKEIDREWQQEIANAALNACQKIAEVPVVQQDSKVNYHVINYSLETGAEMTFHYETEPTIPSADPKQLHLTRIARPEITEEKINEAVRQITFFFAQWEPVEGRPAQEGDFVILDVDVIETDPQEPLFTGTRFEVSDKSMANWMKALVIGASVDSFVEGVSIPDEDAPQETKETYLPKKVRIHVKKIETAILPSDDAGMLQLLGVSSREEFHTSVARLLNQRADNFVQDSYRKQAVDFLLGQHPFDLPRSFVVKEAQFRFSQLTADPQFKEHWGSLSKPEQDEMLQTVFAQSEKAVRLFYLCRKIIKDANIRLSPDDLPKPPTTPLEILVKPVSDAALHPEEDLHEAESYSKLILEKAEDYLISHASTQELA